MSLYSSMNSSNEGFAYQPWLQLQVPLLSEQVKNTALVGEK